MLIKMIEALGMPFKNWGAPKDWAPEQGICNGLPARLENTNAGYFWVSAWEPTPEELKILNGGGSIHLGVSAHQHPVVFMRVNKID